MVSASVGRSHLTDETILVHNPQAIWTRIGGAVALLKWRTTGYSTFELAGVSAEAWDFLARPRRVVEIVEHLAATFDVDSDQAREGLIPFLADLEEFKLVVIVT